MVIIPEGTTGRHQVPIEQPHRVRYDIVGDARNVDGQPSPRLAVVALVNAATREQPELFATGHRVESLLSEIKVKRFPLNAVGTGDKQRCQLEVSPVGVDR